MAARWRICQTAGQRLCLNGFRTLLYLYISLNRLLSREMGSYIDLFSFWPLSLSLYLSLYLSFYLSRSISCAILAGEMIISNERYLMNENESSMYAVQMTLVIRKLHKSDMGGYKCISKNSIGDAEGTIRLYGKFNACRNCVLFFWFTLTNLLDAKTYVNRLHVYAERH